MLGAGTSVFALVVYGIVIVGIAVLVTRGRAKTLVEFLLAGRSSKWVVSAFSVAATWIWAPAIFISSQKAYEQGLVGFGWFFVPNVLCLIIFGFLAHKLYSRFPEGYTLPQYMREQYSPRVHGLYLVQFTVLQFCSFAVQLLAGATILSWLTGISFGLIVVVLAAIALSYSFLGGFRASLITDGIQMLFMLVIGIVGVVLVVTNVGAGTIQAGFGGLSGEYDQFFSREGIMVMLTFGIVNTIGLLAGPFGDQAFWQRVFGMKRENVVRSFSVGAVIFGAIPLLFSVLGFAGAGLGMEVADAQLINVEVIAQFAGPLVSALVVVMIIAGLSSTLDSNLCAVSSLFSVDLREIFGLPLDDNINWGRASMFILAAAGIGIAIIPGITILHLFLFYGTLRATTLFPTVLTIQSPRKVEERGVFYGIVGSIAIGVPVFAIGRIIGSWPTSLVGAVLAVGLSGVISMMVSRRIREVRHR